MKNIGKYLTLATVALLSTSPVSAEPATPALDDLSDLYDTGIYSKQEKELMDIQKQINAKWSQIRKEQKSQHISDRKSAVNEYREMARDY